MSILGNQTRYQDAPYFEAVGDGATLSYALPWQPGYPGALIVVVGGVPQPVGAYQVSGYNLLLSSAPGNGARILVFGRGMRGVLNQPASGSVVSASLDQGALVIPATATVESNPATGLRSKAIATMQKFADEFGSSLSSSGYQKLPSGLIIQWGLNLAAASGNPNLTVTLPIAFPNSTLFAGGAVVGSAIGNFVCLTATLSASQVQFSVQANGSISGQNVRWIAIGY